MFKQFASLTDAFLNYFDVDLASTNEQLDQVGRIRYRVYCEEFGFESPAAFPNHREQDLYDAYSLQCLVTHRRSSHPAACVRLICASDEHALPLETHCLENIYADYVDSLMGRQRHRVAEVSRLAVDPAFRKRAGERHTRLGEFDAVDCSHQEQRTFSLISIAAILAGLSMSSLADRSELYTMMEPNLPRLLHRVGIMAQKAGDTMEYHGQRAPYYIATEPALENMREDLHTLYDAIHARLSRHYRSQEHVA